MILQIEGQISIFDIMPYIKETNNDAPQKETHNCPFYMFVKNGESYATKTCDIDWSECGKCPISKYFYEERDRLMAGGTGLTDAVFVAREAVYNKFGRGGDKASA